MPKYSDELNSHFGGFASQVKISTEPQTRLGVNWPCLKKERLDRVCTHCDRFDYLCKYREVEIGRKVSICVQVIWQTKFFAMQCKCNQKWEIIVKKQMGGGLLYYHMGL